MPTHDDQVAQAFSDAYSVLVERTPSAPPIEEIIDQTRGGAVAAPAPDIATDFVFAGAGDDLAPAPRRPLASAALAGAAVVLLVAGLAMFSRNRDDVGTGSAPVPEIAISTVPNVQSGDPPDEWSLVLHEEAPVGDPFGGFDESAVSALVAGGPGFVAVGSSGPHAAVWTSIDGHQWSRVPHDELVFGGTGDMWMNDVTVGGPGLVAVGEERGCSDLVVLEEGGSVRVDEVGVPEPDTVCEDANAVVWTSTDGLDWSRVAHDESVFGGAKFYRMSSVTGGGPGLVAVGRSEDFGGGGTFVEGSPVDVDAVTWTSVDGTTWSRIEDAAVFGGDRQQEMIDVTVGGPGLVAVGRDGGGFSWDNSTDQDAAVWTSVDGSSWSRIAHDEEVFGVGLPVMLSVTAEGPGLVAVGWSQPRMSNTPVWTSVDGVTWTRVAHEQGPAIRGAMASIAAGGPGLVAVGARDGQGTAWTSADGATWSEVPTDPQSTTTVEWLSDVVADGDRLVGFGFTMVRTSTED